MKIILVANQKGGSGKTTVAEEIAYALERHGFKVCFTNLDNQGISNHVSRSSEPDDDFQVVDTPGALNEDFQAWCRSADMVIIPTMPGIYDLEPLKRCWDLAVSSNTKAPIGVVVNCCSNRNVVDRDFVEMLKGKGMDVLGTIPRTEALKQAQIEGKSVVEYARLSSTSLAFRTLDYNIRHILGVHVEGSEE